ncbi:23S rRNA (guanosine(2251)-2'-O)-methyltransferase RlmB [Anaerophilus nitritogenes]|uniref:23S rRNA (guanosine(2251)-2'-O)-methyltransferase RlmB n=1 Tax=Anaerophilus nitritogenes TaxID=2498136 RepID=UPI00101D7F6A|nr:23S rRNA (guanosine(2251)-2'-O)-methyltransferase RlmB [Anaerophilus nitritogenes]
MTSSIMYITSEDNGIIKTVKQLEKRRYRQKSKQYMIEGIRIIKDAIENEKSLEYIIFCEELYKNKDADEIIEILLHKGIKVYQVPTSLFIKLADTQTPQGILGILSMEDYQIEEIFKTSNGLFLVLDRIQDPGNLGTMIRTADAAGFDAVVLSKGCVDLYNLKTIRSTMGSIFHMPIIHMEETIGILELLREQNIHIITTSLDTKYYYDEIDYTKKVAIVIGNEGNGVEKEVIDLSDSVVKIPMIGCAESLNASVASSIVMYEAVRQRRNQKIFKI